MVAREPERTTYASHEDRDHAWLYAIARGDREAFTRLYEAYAVTLANAANRVLQYPAAAEEVVQDVFLSIWKSGAALHVRGSVQAYLFGATRNGALRWLRRRGAETRWHARAAELAEERQRLTESSDVQLDAHEIDDYVRTAIDSLPPRAREVLLLRWTEQLSYNEIASILGMAPKTVENHIGRALKTLRGVLKVDRG